MRKLTGQFRNILRTIAGGLIGFVIALVCLIGMAAIAHIDEAAHWKGTLIFFAILLPIACVVGGAFAVHSHPKRLNYFVANTGIVVLATLLAITVIIVLIPVPF